MRRGPTHLLVVGDAALQALQLGVADLPELVLRHGDHALALGDQRAAVAHEAAVVAAERLQDLRGGREAVWSQT